MKQSILSSSSTKVRVWVFTIGVFVVMYGVAKLLAMYHLAPHIKGY